MFKEQTEGAIRDRMLDKIELDLYKGEGSDLYQLVTPLAMELASFYTWLDYFKEVIFGRQLDENFVARAEAFGVFRKMGEKTTEIISITTSDAKVIDEGTRLMSSTGLFYEIEEALVFADAGTQDVRCTAEDVGVLYNIKANDLKFVTDIPTVTEITHNPFTTGIDIETLEQLQQRFLEKLRNPSSSGNIADYERWSKSIDGVVYAKVYPLYDGPGTVKIVASGENGMPLPDDVLEELKETVMELSPIGADVRIFSTTKKIVDITVSGLSIVAGHEETIVTDMISKALRMHLEVIPPGAIIVIKQLLGVIMTVEGVDDVTSITINDNTVNIDLVDEEKGILGGVTYSG